MIELRSRADLIFLRAFDGITDSNGNPCVWLNSYICKTCCPKLPSSGRTHGLASAKCNDRCPKCDAEIEPHESAWCGPESEALQALWRALPDFGQGNLSNIGMMRIRPSLSVSDVAMMLDALEPEHYLAKRLSVILLECLDEKQQELYAAYRSAVSVRDGELELDDDGEVSISDDNGAHVMTWTWVDDKTAGLGLRGEDDEGTEGQDRESYSDDQNRENYAS